MGKDGITELNTWRETFPPENERSVETSPLRTGQSLGEVRERSLAPLVADCYQTMSDVERTVKQLTFTSASEVVARKVKAAIHPNDSCLLSAGALSNRPV